jgi:chromate reductase
MPAWGAGMVAASAGQITARLPAHAPGAGHQQPCDAWLRLCESRRPVRLGRPSQRCTDMKTCKVAVLLGSLRRDSYNRRLMLAVERLSPPQLEYAQARIDDLPLYSQDFDADFPPNARRLKRDIESAQALLFVTPEYNRSVPGVLKNAIDIASRPWGHEFLRRQAGGGDRYLDRCGRHRDRPAPPAQFRCISSTCPTLGQPEVYLHFRDEVIAADGTVANDSTRLPAALRRRLCRLGGALRRRLRVQGAGRPGTMRLSSRGRHRPPTAGVRQPRSGAGFPGPRSAADPTPCRSWQPRAA